MVEEKRILKIFMPIIRKNVGNGEYKISAILSDDSLDRDDEMMSKSLVQSWATKKSLPALMDHKNSMDSYHADWENIRYEEIGENGALMADPVTFPTTRGKELAIQLKHAKNIGVSISAIPLEHEFIEKSYDGVKKKIKVYTKAKILEASFIPIQSNEHSRSMRIAKSFSIHKTSIEVENIENKNNNKVKKMEDLEKMKEENLTLKKELEELQLFKKEAIVKAEEEAKEEEKKEEEEKVAEEEAKATELKSLKTENLTLKKKISETAHIQKGLDEPNPDDEDDVSKTYDLKDRLRKLYKVNKK